MSTMLRRAVAVVTAIAIIALSAGGTRASSSRANRNFVLRVGLVFPFTGDLSTFGPSLDKSALLAVKLINSALKQDHITWASIHVVGSEDDQTTPAAGVEAAKKLVTINHAQVIVGSMASSVTLAIIESVGLPNHVIVITPTSSDPSVTLLKNENHLVWRVYPSDTLQGAALAQAMGKAFGKHATINVGARNDAFGTALATIFEKNWKAGGGKIGKVVIYNPAETSFDADAQKLASGNPNGWMIADFPATFEKMGPALVRAGGWSPSKTFMTEALDNNDELNKIGAPATDGLRGTAASAPKGTNAQALEALFTRTYPGVKYTGFEGTSFDAVMLAFLAALKADSSSPNAVKQQLRPVSGPAGTSYTWRQLPRALNAIVNGQSVHYIGAWGSIEWDSHGDPGSAIYVVWQHKNGQTSNIQTFTFHKKK